MTQVASFHDCDAVIVNHNAGKLLADCVSSVFAAGAAGAIVVDNASNDDSIDYLERTHGNSSALSVIRNASNLGFAAACNIGARTSSAHRMPFLNPDSVLAVDALSQMISVLAR